MLRTRAQIYARVGPERHRADRERLLERLIPSERLLDVDSVMRGLSFGLLAITDRRLISVASWFGIRRRKPLCFDLSRIAGVGVDVYNDKMASVVVSYEGRFIGFFLDEEFMRTHRNPFRRAEELRKVIIGAAGLGDYAPRG